MPNTLSPLVNLRLYLSDGGFHLFQRICDDLTLSPDELEHMIYQINREEGYIVTHLDEQGYLFYQWEPIGNKTTSAAPNFLS